MMSFTQIVPYAPAPLTILGRYLAIGISDLASSLAAGAVLSSARWVDASNLMVLDRLAALVEVTAAITLLAPMDVTAFIFRGSTGFSSGVGSTVIPVGNQKLRASMAPSLLLANGEIRTLGKAGLTPSSGKTNDPAPFGAAAFGFGSQVVGWQDLYVRGTDEHPVILANNEGVEIQALSAGPTTGSLRYFFLYEWSEILPF